PPQLFMRPADARRVLARAIALAFLDGEWRGPPMVTRAAEALSAGGRWLRELVHDVRAAFPRPPHDMLDLLTDFIERNTAFPRVWWRGELDPIVRRPRTPAPQMGKMRWAVPELPTLADLAGWLRIQDAELAWLADCKGLERVAASPRLLRYRYRW